MESVFLCMDETLFKSGHNCVPVVINASNDEAAAENYANLMHGWRDIDEIKPVVVVSYEKSSIKTIRAKVAPWSR